VYLSPHLDDAVLSAGGFIYEKVRAGDSVETWTIISGFPPPGELTPLAQILQAQWGTATAEEAIRLRREEDVRAVSRLGAKFHHFDIPDCIYRRGPGGEPLYQEIFINPHPLEEDLPDEIAGTLNELLLPDDQVVCQFAIGNHVDHILVRWAAELLDRPLGYVADLPYHFKHPNELEKQTIGMEMVLHEITESGLKAWIEGIFTYRSQLSSVFDRVDQVEPAIRQFCAQWSGFPLWRPV
jgi:LmbE family N-acetylglucosaminyl deacetylase